MKKTLAIRLNDEGYVGRVERFREVAAEEFRAYVVDQFGWSLDETLYHPDHAAELCHRIRRRLNCESITYPTILREIAQMRKSGSGRVNLKPATA